MWTTLSTGAYPATHGITCFWSQHPTKLDTFVYANDSKKCQAEQLWNVTAEAGKKTLYFIGQVVLGLQLLTVKIYMLLKVLSQARSIMGLVL